MPVDGCLSPRCPLVLTQPDTEASRVRVLLFSFCRGVRLRAGRLESLTRVSVVRLLYAFPA